MDYERHLLKSLVRIWLIQPFPLIQSPNRHKKTQKKNKKATAIKGRHRYSEPMQQAMETCKAVQDLQIVWKKNIRQKSTL